MKCLPTPKLEIDAEDIKYYLYISYKKVHFETKVL